MAYLEELLPEFRKGAKIRRKSWGQNDYFQKDIIDDMDVGELLYNDWELVEEPDYDYIIKNKCLCWFWDDNEKSKTLKFLTNVHMEAEYRFNGFWPVHGNCTYKHCRPVRRDEVTFYEDRKDDNK